MNVLHEWLHIGYSDRNKEQYWNQKMSEVHTAYLSTWETFASYGIDACWIPFDGDRLRQGGREGGNWKLSALAETLDPERTSKLYVSFVNDYGTPGIQFQALCGDDCPTSRARIAADGSTVTITSFRDGIQGMHSFSGQLEHRLLKSVKHLNSPEHAHRLEDIALCFLDFTRRVAEEHLATRLLVPAV